MPIVHSLIPYKEGFTEADAGAVALVTADGFTGSRYAEAALVFGRQHKTDAPRISSIGYHPLKPKMPLFGGPYIGLPRAYLHYLKQHQALPDLIEIHARSYVARYLAKKLVGLPLVLYLHNDPRQMKGSESKRQRRWLAQNMAGIFCVSDYVRRCFLDGLRDISPAQHNKIVVIPNAADRVWATLPTKQNLITVIGRMVENKGMLEAAEALAQVLPDFPDWRVVFIGSRGFGVHPPTGYETRIAGTLAPLIKSKQAEILGFLPHQQTRHWQAPAAIALAPSKWQDPAPKAVIEALAAGSAVITSRRGGIAEYATGRAVLLNRTQPRDIAQALRRLLTDASSRQQLQHKAWADFPFTIANMVARLDAARGRILQARGRE